MIAAPPAESNGVAAFPAALAGHGAHVAASGVPGFNCRKNCLGKKGSKGSRVIPISRKSDVDPNRESYRAER